MEDNLAMEVINVALPCICGFLSFSKAMELRTLDHRMRDLVEECLTEERCAAFLEKKLKRENLYVFHDTKEWKEATQSDEGVLKKVITNGTVSRLDSQFPFRTLLNIIKVMHFIPMEAAIAYSNRYGRILIPHEEQVRCIVGDLEEEAPFNGKMYGPCPCPPEDKCQGCRLIDNIPARQEHVSTEGRIHEDGYSVDDFYTCTRTSNGQGVALELKTYFPVCVPNLPPELCCPVCRERTRRTLFMTEVSYQASETSSDHRSTLLSFTPVKSNDPANKRPRRADTWKDRLFSKDAYPPPPYREDGIHKNVPIEHTPDRKNCISIHCENCKQFGLLAPVVPCHTSGFPCETVRCYPQEASLRDGVYEADLGAVLVRQRCNATSGDTPCNKAPLCTKCCFEIWHHVWEARPEGREHHHHAYLNNHGINFIVFCSSCRTCDLRLCHEHAWLSTVCHHS